MIKQIAVVE